MNGTSAPAFLAAAAIAGSSVEMMVRYSTPLFRAASMVQAISGLPPSIARFFPGTPFDPPRAGMSPRIRAVIGALRLQIDGNPGPRHQNGSAHLHAIHRLGGVPRAGQRARGVRD